MTAMTRRAALGATLTLAAATLPRKLRADEGAPGELELRDPTPLPAGLLWRGEGGVVRRVADYAGRGLVLNFWATWCAPCVAEMPALAVLARAVADQRIDVVPVSSDAGGAPAVSAFYAAHHIAHLGVWLDPQQQALDSIGASGLPTTLIIDRKGREVARVAGAADWGVAADVVRALCDSG